MSEENSASPKSRAIKEITEQSFNGWKHHPVTKLVMEFLDAEAAKIKDAVLTKWVNGTETETSRAELRASYRTLQELQLLEFGHIYDAYTVNDEQEEESGTEDHSE